jgi:uncharacterized protein YdaT
MNTTELEQVEQLGITIPEALTEYLESGMDDASDYCHQEADGCGDVIYTYRARQLYDNATRDERNAAEDQLYDTYEFHADWSMDELFTQLAYWITVDRLMEQLREDAAAVSEQIDEKRDAVQDDEESIDLLDELADAIGDLT